MDKLHIIPRRPPTCADEDKSTEAAKIFGKRYLVNILNYINFQDFTVLVNLKHNKYATIISLQATPLPCAGDHLDCVWTETMGPGILGSHTFDKLIITDGKKSLLVNPEVININEQGISLLLPETCSELNNRKIKRHPSSGIQATITQNSAVCTGALLDSGCMSFRIRVTTDSPQILQWINSEAPVNLHLYVDHELLYSGECRIIRQFFEQTIGVFVLGVVNDRFQRYKPKQFRSARYAMVPSPNVLFVHPFTAKKVQLKAIDLSGSGFSVGENEWNSTLFAGIIIPEVELSFAHSLSITCRAQVVYRNTSRNGEKEGMVKCGLAFLDMAMDDQIKLLSLLHQMDNRNSYINTSVDMDALWNFFFETGFIYPEKYSFFQSNKEEIKKIYEMLYVDNPGIARHFIHQEKGTILGHMSMLRFYENSWLIHHHAASKTESMKAGIMVLKQISDYINDLHHLQSAHLKYVFCYYRPDNKFPSRVFGGFAKGLNDPKGCSLDEFAYFHYRQNKDDRSLYEHWELTDARPEDLSELKHFYNHVSGGNMIDAFDLQPGICEEYGVAVEYEKLGFKKEKHIHSLYIKEELRAIIITNFTDIGLNMANLTNCATVVVIDENTPSCYIEAALSQMACKYEHQLMPVLIYPVSYAESKSFPFEKIYSLWILNLEYTDSYFKFCAPYFNSSKKRADSALGQEGMAQ